MNEKSKEEIYKALTMKTLFRYPFNTADAGFKMLVEAVILTLESTELFINVREIYKTIAQKRKIRIDSVDKAIKTAIEHVTSVVKMDKDNFHNAPMMQAFINEKPRSLIFAISETIKAELND